MKFTKLVTGLMLAVLMAMLMGCASSSSSPSSDGAGGYWDDSVITTKVKSAIYDEPTLKVSDISVDTVRGVVTLRGELESRISRKKAEQIARKVEGVRGVKNRIRVVRKAKKKTSTETQ